MSSSDTISELRQIIDSCRTLTVSGVYVTDPDKLLALLDNQKQRWTKVAVLRTERNLLSSQISRHLFMDYAEQGAIDRINKIDAELAALDGVVGEPEASAEQLEEL